MMFDQMGQIAQALGTKDFYHVLKSVVRDLTGSDVSMVMRYSAGGAPSYICHDLLNPDIMAAYLAGPYRLDPVYRHCQGSPRPGVFLLSMLDTSDEQNSRYREDFLDRTGMADDLVLLFGGLGSATVAVVLERKWRYDEADLAPLLRVFPLLLPLQSAHERITLASFTRQNSDAAFRMLDEDGTILFESEGWQRVRSDCPGLERQLAGIAIEKRTIQLDDGTSLIVEPLAAIDLLGAGDWIMLLQPARVGLPPLTMAEMEQGFALASLTPREQDIVRLIFLGNPTAKIADKLGLSINTVKNHKKRLYAKLDITTERELFLAFIDQTSLLPAERHPVQRGPATADLA